jgi:hypothetical protein
VKKHLIAAAGLLLAGAAHAHPGHGAASWHWHATDTAGLLTVAAIACLALLFSRGE